MRYPVLNMKLNVILVLVSFCLSIFIGLSLHRGATSDEAPGDIRPNELLIGFSMDTLKEARWQRDKDYFEALNPEITESSLVIVQGKGLVQPGQIVKPVLKIK